jgi:hypothetical protein
MTGKPRTVDEYLATLPEGQRRALAKVRQAIRADADGCPRA